MTVKRIIFVLLLASTAAIAQDAYKCKSGNGYIYQETPCGTVSSRKPAASGQPMTAAEIQADFERERAAEAKRKAEGVRIDVPSDPGAAFYLMDKVTDQGASRIIITRRIGSSGESWSRRIFNCTDYTVKYLGSGATRAAMDASRPDPNMTNVLPGTIADDVGRAACRGFDVARIATGREGEALAAQTKAADMLAKAGSRDDPARKAAAEHAVLKHLKDPGSASFRGLFVSWLSGGPIVCGYVNAKNSFGGYTGFTRFVAAGSDTAFLESDMGAGEMEKTWAKFCGYRN